MDQRELLNIHEELRSLCICGIAEYFRRFVFAWLTLNFSWDLVLLVFVSLSGNISFDFSYFKHRLANLRQREFLLSVRDSSFSSRVLRVLSFEITDTDVIEISGGRFLSSGLVP